MAEEPDKPQMAGRNDPPAGGRRESGAPAAWGLVGIGFEFLASICVMGALGWYLDGRLNTFPWLLIGGCAIGFAAGLMMMIRAAGRAFKD